MNKKIIIVGGGLTGLSLAYFLKKSDIQSLVLEASLRVGGRIKTITGKNNTPLELGATWFADEHEHLIDLLNELGIEKYPQFRRGTSLFHTENNKPPQHFEVSKNEPPSYRVAGGTEQVIKALHEHLTSSKILVDHKVVEITKKNKEIEVTAKNGKKYLGTEVVLCMPPQLIVSNINFVPQLPQALNELMPKVQTWMANSIKFVLEYSAPFWRSNRLSGMLFSHVGIVSEMYDHTNKEENKFGFTGFLHPNAKHLSKVKRKENVLAYLQTFFGKDVLSYTYYEDEIWNKANLIGNTTIEIQPHLNNGHPLLKNNYMNGQLYLAGTETSANYPGYMNAAIGSAKRVYKQLTWSI